MSEVLSVSAVDKTGKMALHKFHRRPVGEHDINIKVSYSGICHSDIHTAKGEWGPVNFPICVGHEILGEVTEVGKEVTKFKVGDIAGVGCFVDSCRSCDECEEGVEQYCTGKGGMHGTYGSKRSKDLHPEGQTMGGYSSAIVVDANYALKVPENLNCAAAAPLLCAGITCYSPFKFYGLKSGMSLGVIGLGGLGHMAVKIAVAMGCEVTVLSRSPGKEEMAMKLGAKHFLISTDPEQMKKASRSLNMIYDSIAFFHEVSPYLDLLKAQGKLIMVGGVPEAFKISSFSLLPRRLSVGGSCIGGIKETQEMLDFCGEHNITAEIELIPATPEAVEAAWVRTINSDVKFRFVMDTAATLKEE